MSSAPAEAASGAASSQAAAAPAVTLLVKQNPPAGANSCSNEGAALAVAGANVLGSLGRVVVGAPTLIAEIPAILGFIAASVAAGAAAAKYVDCREQAGREVTK